MSPCVLLGLTKQQVRRYYSLTPLTLQQLYEGRGKYVRVSARVLHAASSMLAVLCPATLLGYTSTRLIVAIMSEYTKTSAADLRSEYRRIAALHRQVTCVTCQQFTATSWPLLSLTGTGYQANMTDKC